VTDVTVHQHLPEAMHQAEALREADRLKAELLATVSHELRSPLTSIKGYAATLLRHERRLPREERHEFLLAIVEASDRLGVIIDRLLEMSQLATGVVTIVPTAVDMRRVASEAIAAARERTVSTPSTRFTFALEIDGDIGRQADEQVLVEADPRYIREVLDNLLENAIKYSPNGGTIAVILRLSRPMEARVGVEGGPQEHGRGEQDPGVTAVDPMPGLPPDPLAEPATTLHRPALEIIVRDPGVGIPAEHVGRIFEQFHRVDTRLTREVDGLGLGLALCQRIVELHHGRIWAESIPCDGSAFHVLLPLPAVTSDASEPSAEPSAMKR
jgi:signal transduction histidine kinase